MPPLLLDPQLAPTTVDPPVGLEPACPRPRSDRAQRAIDLLIGALVLIVAAPLIGLALLAVKFTSRGPVIYTQSRLGRQWNNPCQFLDRRSHCRQKASLCCHCRKRQR